MNYRPSTLLGATALSLSLAACVEAPAPLDPKDFVASEGLLTPGLEEVDDVVKKFMRATCTGGVVLTLGFGDEPLLSRGYGHRSGAPTENCELGADVHVGDHVEAVHADSAFRIGSNSKAITAAIVRIVVKQRLAARGLPTTDEYVEALKVFSDETDLVSPALRRAILGNLAPAPIVSCAVPAGGKAAVSTSGQTDPRWVDITLGQLLGHRSGLPRSTNPVQSKLATIRGISSLSELQADVAAMNPPDWATAKLADVVPGAVFLRPATLEELLIGSRDVCLNYAPGGDLPSDNFDPYSNLGYAIVHHVAEHVSGRSLASRQGDDDHQASLLAQFNSAYLGFTAGTDSEYGIYHSQPVHLLRDHSEPDYRSWDGETRMGAYWDGKRPYCVWDEQSKTCDASAFIASKVRFNWEWSDTKVRTGFVEDSIAPGIGLLAAEMPLYLKFMARFWVSGGGNSPLYGRERTEANDTDASRWHIGELGGTHSTVAQFRGDSIRYYVIPRDEDGELVLTALESDPIDLPVESCKLPRGLNMALATNQVNDETCGANTICGQRYMALRDVVKEALCNVDWQQVSPDVTLN